jgi:hypothetical protein
MIVDAHRGAHNIKLRENNGISIYNQVPSRAQVVSTLRTGYPHIQASSQDNGSRLPAQGSSGSATCPRGSGSCLPAQGSFGAATCPRGSGSRLPARGSSGATTCHLGSSTHLLAQGSSRAVMCLEDGLYMLQAIKQISPGDPVIMISIGACACISSKVLRDKGCSARSQGVQQAAH